MGSRWRVVGARPRRRWSRKSIALGGWSWSGLGGKTLWDWLQLLGALATPIVVAMLGALFARREREREERQRQADAQRDGLHRQTEREIAEDRAREAVLETYLDAMSELLIDKHLGKSEAEAGTKDVARARTLTALRRLDGERKGTLLRFLYESDLISDVKGDEGQEEVVTNQAAINLSGADLSAAYLHLAELSRANLSETHLNGANLSDANLYDANLSGANLSRASLFGANLTDANLSDANLSGADLSGAYLRLANLSGANLSGANLSDANLSGTNLSGADLDDANLNDANLFDADLSGADLVGADLRNAKLTDEQLAQAISLEGTIMPDGSKHE